MCPGLTCFLTDICSTPPFADVFKHALLARLLIALGAKEKPYFYLDTHAGTGRYDLAHEWAWKTREFETGIGKLWDLKDIPEALAPYMDVVRPQNAEGRLRYFPGSPPVVAPAGLSRSPAQTTTSLPGVRYFRAAAVTWSGLSP